MFLLGSKFDFDGDEMDNKNFSVFNFFKFSLEPSYSNTEKGRQTLFLIMS